MTGRYIVKTQDDYFNVTDTYNNVPIVNGIRTEIEAEWLADHINTLNDEKDIITDDYTDLHEKYDELRTKWVRLSDEFATIHIENMDLKKENKKIIDTINNKITEKGTDWYKAEDNSKEEKEANLQLNVLEEVKEEIIKTMEE